VKVFCTTCADTEPALLLNWFSYGIVLAFFFFFKKKRIPAMGRHIERTFESSCCMCFVTEIISCFQIKYALFGTVTRNGISASEDAPFCG